MIYEPRPCNKCGSDQIEIRYHVTPAYDGGLAYGFLGSNSTSEFTPEKKWLSSPPPIPDNFCEERRYYYNTQYWPSCDYEVIVKDIPNNVSGGFIAIGLEIPEYGVAFLGVREYFMCTCSRCKFEWTDALEPNLYNKEKADEWSKYNAELRRLYEEKKNAILEKYKPANIKPLGLLDIIFAGKRKSK